MRDHDLGESLAHVLWIGGAPDAGKSSVAARLAEAHDLQVYHFDRHEPAHFERHDSVRHPALHAVHPDRMPPELRWVSRSVEEITETTIASWSQRFGMAVEDLLAMPRSLRIVAEGPGFFPDLVASVISSPRQAIWLVPTESFKRASVLRRDKPGNRRETSDPDFAQANLIARDLLIAEHVREQASVLNLTTLEIDAASDIDAVVARLAAHFEPFLRR